MSSVWCQVCVEAEPTVTSIEHRLISNHRHFHCLSNSLFGKESITSPQWGNSTEDWHIPLTKGHWCVKPGGCFTNVSRALQNNLAKIYNARNHIYGENFKLKLCTCAQSMALCTSANFQLEILKRSTISAIHKFRENILESSRNVSETTPCPWYDVFIIWRVREPGTDMGS